MLTSKAGVLLAFVIVLAIPFLVRSPDTAGGESPDIGPDGTLIVVTPHIEQIREEFGRAFARWHERVYGTPVVIDWRTPGGTSDIVRGLKAQFAAAAINGQFTLDGDGWACQDGTIGYDVFFGGGSYEHGKVKQGVKVEVGGEAVMIPMSVPAEIPTARLESLFGENRIGSQRLYDPDRFWIGTALSGFGIVYNRRVLEDLGLPEPTSFEDLTRPELSNLVALADPRQSGSVTTTYESILNNLGWDGGWRLLREMCANARYFASSSTRPPIDISQGEAAVGLAIDFYGRSQAQGVLAAGETAATGRVGYVDPAGAVYIDADPVSLMRGGPNPELAQRFVEFTLTVEAQVLWQLPSLASDAGAANPKDPADPTRSFGPERYELRRMPVLRSSYDEYGGAFIDQANPFELAADLPRRGWRTGIAPLMTCFGIDSSTELRAAWSALSAARADERFPEDRLAEMESLFYAMPEHTLADGTTVLLSEASYGAVKADTEGWGDPLRGHLAMIAYTEFFKSNYRRVVSLATQSN